jgi:hypothetical protein
MSDYGFSNNQLGEKVLLSQVIISDCKKKRYLLENPNTIYLDKRKNILDYLYRLVKGYDYSREIFYFTLELLDSLLISKQNLILDLTVIGCFLLSSKNKRYNLK